MAKRRKYRFALRRSSPLTLAAVLAAVVLSTIALLVIHGAITQAEDDYEQLRQEAAQILGENQQISDRIASLGTVESIMQIAEEELDLVEKDSVIIEPGN